MCVAEDEVIVRVNWEKVDKDLYAAMCDKEFQNTELSIDINTIREVDSSVHSVNTILTSAAIICGGRKKTKKCRRKTKVWNSELKKATAESKHAHWQYKQHRSRGTLNQEIIQNRKLAKLRLRRLYRQEVASKRTDNKREIMDARREDSKLFHNLIRRQRGVSDSKFSHMRLRTPTGSLVLDRSIRDGDLARGIHALLCESKLSEATIIVGIVLLRL